MVFQPFMLGATAPHVDCDIVIKRTIISLKANMAASAVYLGGNRRSHWWCDPLQRVTRISE